MNDENKLPLVINYKDYMAARNAALQTLIRFEVNKLPVRMSAGIKQMGITLTPYSKAEAFLTGLGFAALLRETDGLSVSLQGKYYIFYRNDMAPGRQRFTVAHELGHIVLGHLDGQAQKDQETREYMVNVFASMLLAPACVLYDLNAFTPERISALCDISLSEARIQAKQMGPLKKYGTFGMSPLEQKVHEQFQDFIFNRTQGSAEKQSAVEDYAGKVST